MLQASLDEPTSCLVMHRTEPSSLQSLSLQLADKLYNLVENNERILDQKPFFTRGMQVSGDPGGSLVLWQRDLWLGFTLHRSVLPPKIICLVCYLILQWKYILMMILTLSFS